MREQALVLHDELEAAGDAALSMVERLARIQELGRALTTLGDAGTAAGWFRRVLEYWQAHAPVQGRVRVLAASADLALALVGAGREEEARPHAEAARKGLAELERAAPEQMLRFSADLARVYTDIGPLEMARELWHTALRHVPRDAPSDGDRMLISLADVERRAGRVAAAHARLSQAERIIDRSRSADHPARAAARSLRARLGADLEQLDLAYEQLAAAVTLRSGSRRSRASAEQADDLALLATWARRRGDPASARRHLDALGTLLAARYGRDSAELAMAMDAAGVSAAEAGDFAAARGAFEAARDLATSRGDAAAGHRAALRAAWVTWAMTPAPETREAFLTAARGSARTVSRPPGLVAALVAARVADGDPASAYAAVRDAMAVLPADERSVSPILDALLTAATELARAGVDVAAETLEILLSPGGEATGERLARQRSAAAQDSSLAPLREAVDDAIEHRGRAQVAKLHAEVRVDAAVAAESAARVVEAEIDRVAASPTADRAPGEMVRDLARWLGIGAWQLHLRRFAHVVSGEHRDVALAVAGNTGAVYLRTIGAAETTDAWIRATRSGDPGEAVVDAGRRLAGAVLGPLRTLAGLRPGDRLHVVADAPWAGIPFAALPSPSGEGGTWVTFHEIVRHVDGRLSERATPSTAAPTGPRVVGAPALLEEDAPIAFAPRARQREVVESVAMALGVPAWSGEQATTAAIRQAPSPRVLVVATHAYRVPEVGVPERAIGLVGTGALASLSGAPGLEPGLGWLSCEAIARSELSSTELVDLSACVLPEGAEVEVGLALVRAFQRAGARSVVVALGQVPESGVVAFEQAFHQGLAAGETPAQAVRSAQITLSDELPASVWGMFCCFGETSTRGNTSLARAPGPSDLAHAELAVGEIRARLADPEGARQAYDRSIRHHPGHAEAHFQRGRCLEELGRYPEALRAYQEAVRLEPVDGGARYAVAQLLRKGGHVDEAIGALTELGRQFPGDGATWRDLVHLHRQRGDLADARHAAERWLAVARDDDAAWHHYASILEALDEPQKALVARERTVELKPASALHWSNLGVHHARRRNYQQAEFGLLKAVELDPDHAPSWRSLAQVRLELERPAEAETSARTAIQRDPDHPLGHYLLGLALRSLERLDEARPVLKRASELGHEGAAAALGELG